MARKRRSFYRYYDSYFPPSTPRKARGGIKAQSRRGTFGESWWARRWIEVLESFNIGARLGRGRSYARKGQVLSIDIEKGKVSAKVQGSRTRPYSVTMKVKVLGKTEWKKLAKVLSSQAIFAAKLLAGEMPDRIEDAFNESGLSLFPAKRADLHTDCSCPDWSNPCKHIAAVFYLLGEEFDRDPFLIFKLRGMEREELIGLLGGEPSAKSRPGRKEITSESNGEHEAPEETEPLSEDPGLFWGQALPDDDPGEEVRIPGFCAALPKQLGSFPFWRGQESFLPTLEAIYRRASPGGLAVFLGERRLPEGK
jgi:uncharacterized Zn finger protein